MVIVNLGKVGYHHGMDITVGIHLFLYQNFNAKSKSERLLMITMEQ